MGYVDRFITCTNRDGYSTTFGERQLDPFLLVDATGIYEVANNVTISNNTMSDGGAYQGSVAKVRNIVLTIKDIDDHVVNRNTLRALFKAGEPGELVFHEDTTELKISYYVESITSTGAFGERTYTVSLLCPDPFWYAMNDITVYMAAWNDNFEFQHEFTSLGEEFGYRSSSTLQTITNENASDGIGMDILIKAIGAVSNPSVTHVERSETIEVGSAAKPLSMVSGDELRITTSDNDKHVYLTHNGTTTEINEYLTEASVFIQLMRGANSIGYNADSGVANMIVEITYRLKYPGA